MNTGIVPHHGYTHINSGLEARKISIALKNAAFPTANRIRLLIPNIFFLGSSGYSLLIISPAMANIMDNSQLTPMRSIKLVLSGETVQSAYPVAVQIMAFIIS